MQRTSRTIAENALLEHRTHIMRLFDVSHSVSFCSVSVAVVHTHTHTHSTTRVLDDPSVYFCPPASSLSRTTTEYCCAASTAQESLVTAGERRAQERRGAPTTTANQAAVPTPQRPWISSVRLRNVRQNIIEKSLTAIREEDMAVRDSLSAPAGVQLALLPAGHAATTSTRASATQAVS